MGAEGAEDELGDEAAVGAGEVGEVELIVDEFGRESLVVARPRQDINRDLAG